MNGSPNGQGGAQHSESEEPKAPANQEFDDAQREEDAPLNQTSSFIDHVPPSQKSVLQALNPALFETSPHDFDEIAEALSNLHDSNQSSAVLEGLLARIEQFDLARDAVGQSLGEELRRSMEGLLAGMRQVQDLDLETARTLLHVVAARRRLQAAKRNLFQAKLRVKFFSERRENRVKIKSLIDRLVALKRMRDACYALESPLADAIEIAISTENTVRTQFDHSLKPVSSVLTELEARLAHLKDKMVQSMTTLMMGPQVDQEHFNAILACFQAFKMAMPEVLGLMSKNWSQLIESHVNTKGDQSALVRHATSKGAFARIVDSSKALNRTLGLLKDSSLVSIEEVATIKKDTLQFLSKVAEDYLKSAFVRSQVLDDFAVTIQEAGRLVDRLDDLFGVGEVAAGEASAHIMVRTKIESSIRQRARVYAQQYQAEGFQAMRGLLWRELWVDVAGGDGDFAKQIFSRLGCEISVPVLVITSTMASGVPRQIQRTLDLMRKLPSSAAGEAFLGLLRIVDLYLLAVLSVFVPSHIFLDAKRESKNPARLYVIAAKEVLAEWLLPTSPRASAPPTAAPSAEASEDDTNSSNFTVKLCEMEYLADESASFELALIGAGSLDFLKRLLLAMERPLSEPLPSVERNKMASKMFIDVPVLIDKVQGLVHRSAAERLCQYCVMPPLERVYIGDEVDGMDGSAQMQMFQETLSQMQVNFAVIQSNPRLTESARAELWDEACACFFDKYLDAIASLKQCSLMDRGNMILHLASFNEVLLSWPQSKRMLSQATGGRAQRARTRVDDYIKAFYYDKRQDLFEWMQRRGSDLDPWHYQAILYTGGVGRAAGPMSYVREEGGSRAIGDWKDLQRDFDRVLNALYT